MKLLVVTTRTVRYGSNAKILSNIYKKNVNADSAFVNIVEKDVW